MWTSSGRALAELHATYVDAVNRAVTDGRDELVAELEREYAREREKREPPVGIEPTTFS